MAEVLTYEVDTSQWEALMSELDYRRLKAAWKSGLRPSAKMIEQGALAQLDAEHPAASKYRKEVKIELWSKGGGFTVGLSQGEISFAMSKSGKLIEYSHLYILRWLSAGTQERYTKSGARRGKIKASHFFSEGVNASIHPAAQSLGDNITKALTRAAQRARMQAKK